MHARRSEGSAPAWTPASPARAPAPARAPSTTACAATSTAESASSATEAAAAARRGRRTVGSLRARRILHRALRARLPRLQRGDWRRQLSGALPRAAIVPQLAELGVVVRVLRRLGSGRAAAFVKRLAEARLGNAGGHGRISPRPQTRPPIAPVQWTARGHRLAARSRTAPITRPRSSDHAPPDASAAVTHCPPVASPASSD